MNNFLDLLATDTHLNIDIGVTAQCDNGIPICRILVNHTILYDDLLEGTENFTCCVDLLSPIQIQISMQGKIYSAEKETGISLNQVDIDGFAIVPDFTHLAVYENDHMINQPVSYLGYNGTWTLDITEPFYRWRHRTTGQGWLLEPTTGFRDCVPSSSNTTSMKVHSGAGNTIPTTDSRSGPLQGLDWAQTLV